MCVGSIIYPSPGHTCLPMNTSANLTLSSHTTLFGQHAAFTDAYPTPQSTALEGTSLMIYRHSVGYLKIWMGSNRHDCSKSHPAVTSACRVKKPLAGKTKSPVSLFTGRCVRSMPGRTKALSDSISSSRKSFPSCHPQRWRLKPKPAVKGWIPRRLFPRSTGST